MKREAALMRRRRWATAAGTWQQEKGLKLFVGSDKQMVPLPAGKRLLWVLCLSNMWTQYKKEGGVGWGGLRARGSAAASRGPQGPGLATATLALPKNVCNPRVDWGDPELSPAMQRGSLLSAALKEEMGGSQRGAEGGGGQDQGRWCPFLSQALWELPAIVQKLQLHFSDLLCTPVDSGYWLSSWTWKGYDPHL